MAQVKVAQAEMAQAVQPAMEHGKVEATVTAQAIQPMTEYTKIEEQEYPVPCTPFELKLSAWDACYPPVYSKRLLCFSLPADTPIDKKEQIVSCFLYALRATVRQIPWLAGTVASPSQRTRGRWAVLPEGAAYLDVRDHGALYDFEALKAGSFPCDALNANDLCPLPAWVYLEDTPVCRIRVNFVNGGIILAFQVSHIACDGQGIMQIMKKFADYYCEAQKLDSSVLNAAPGSVSPAEPFVYDRTAILNGGGVPGDIERHPAWTTAPRVPFKLWRDALQCVSFRIDADAMKFLKDQVAPVDAVNPAKRSSHDAIVAMIWRSLMRARLSAGVISADSQVNMSMAVDLRAQLGLPKPYYGNAIYGIRLSLPLQELIGEQQGAESSSSSEQTNIESLKATAQLLRTQLDSATAEQFRDLLGFVERTTGPKMQTRMIDTENYSSDSMLMITWFRFPAHMLFFGDEPGVGLGHADAYRLPYNYVIPGTPAILPRSQGKNGGDACEFVMVEPTTVIEALSKDEVFTRFVKTISLGKELRVNKA